MKRQQLLSGVAIAVIIFGSISHFCYADSIQKIGESGQINWSYGTLEATGFGICDPDFADTEAERKIIAMRAAMNDGYRNLAEVVEGVKVDSESTVQDMILTRDVIRTRVQAFVRGARRTQEEYEEQENGAIACTVTLEAPLSGSGGFANVILPYAKPLVIDKTRKPATVVLRDPTLTKLTVEETIKEYPTPAKTPAPTPTQASETSAPDPTPTPTPKPTPKPADTPEVVDRTSHGRPMITGVVVNTIGTGYSWNLFPKVVSLDEKTVFDITIAENWGNGSGFTPFQNGIDAGRTHERVAMNPLVVKAQKIDGVVVFISKEDAEKIIALNNEMKILFNGKIVFVVSE